MNTNQASSTGRNRDVRESTNTAESSDQFFLDPKVIYEQKEKLMANLELNLGWEVEIDPKIQASLFYQISSHHQALLDRAVRGSTLRTNHPAAILLYHLHQATTTMMMMMMSVQAMSTLKKFSITAKSWQPQRHYSLLP